MAVAVDVFNDVLFCAVLFPMRSDTELSQFLRFFLSTLVNEKNTMKKFTFLCATVSVISVQLTLIPLESKDQGQLVALAKCNLFEIF